MILITKFKPMIEEFNWGVVAFSSKFKPGEDGHICENVDEISKDKLIKFIEKSTFNPFYIPMFHYIDISNDVYKQYVGGSSNINSIGPIRFSKIMLDSENVRFVRRPLINKCKVYGLGDDYEKVEKICRNLTENKQFYYKLGRMVKNLNLEQVKYYIDLMEESNG